MTVLCLLCVALAVWWAMPPPTRPDGPPQQLRSKRTRRAGGSSRAAGGLAALVSAVALAGSALADGVRGSVLGLAALVVGSTVAGLLRERARARRAGRRRTEVAEACTALAAQLRVGQVPSVALETAARDHPVLGEARDAQSLGGDVVRVWRAQAQQPGCGGLLDLARGWQVSSRTGAPMATILEQVAAALSAEHSLRDVVAGELSAPRATGKVMAVLPACGVGLGYLLGGDPVGWLLSGPLGWGCLLAGTVLACLGVLWIEALARRTAG